jgi:hypothetical protein
MTVIQPPACPSRLSRGLPHTSPPAPLPYPILARVSSPSRSSTAPPPPVRRCTPAGRPHASPADTEHMEWKGSHSTELSGRAPTPFVIPLQLCNLTPILGHHRQRPSDQKVTPCTTPLASLAKTGLLPSISRTKPPYFQLLGDGKAFLECVLAFVLSLGFQLKHKATCSGGGGLTRHSHYVRVRLVG